MGYRIDFRVGGGVLEAFVSAYVSAIAREIGAQARLSSVQNVLVDLRRLQDRHGRLRRLLAANRVMAARRLGCEMQRFEDHAAALAWLRGPQSAQAWNDVLPHRI